MSSIFLTTSGVGGTLNKSVNPDARQAAFPVHECLKRCAGGEENAKPYTLPSLHSPPISLTINHDQHA